MHHLARTLLITGGGIALAACSPVRVIVQPPTQTVEAGATATFNVQVFRSGYADPVQLSLSPPTSPHYTASLQPNPVPGNQAQLTVQVATTAPLGAYVLDVPSTPATRPPLFGEPSNRGNLVVGPCGARWIAQFGTSEGDSAWSARSGTHGDLFALTRLDRDSYVMRFDGNGNLLWQEPVPGAELMDVDPQGNVLVAARAVQNNAYQYQVRRYSPSRNLDWLAILGEDPQVINQLTATAVDGAGNVYVTGYTTGDLGGANPDNTHTNWEGWIAKTDSSGTLRWLAQTLTFDHDAYRDVAVGGADGVYVLAALSAGVAALRKLDADTGEPVWTENLPGPSYANGALAVDTAGNVYVAVDGQNPVGALLRKYSPGQALLWSVPLDTRGISYPRALVVDASGGPIIAGADFRGARFTNARIARFDANGMPGWELSFDAPFEISVPFQSIDLDPAGDMYLAGSTDGSLGGQNRGRSDAWIGKVRQGGCPIQPVPR